MLSGETPPNTPPTGPRTLHTLSGIGPVSTTGGSPRGVPPGGDTHSTDLARCMWSVRGFSDSSEQDETKNDEAEPFVFNVEAPTFVPSVESDVMLERPPGLPGATYDKRELLLYDDGERHVRYGFCRMDNGIQICVDLSRSFPLASDLEITEQTTKV